MMIIVILSLLFVTEQRSSHFLVLWAELHPLKRCIEVLTPDTCQ